MLGTILRTTIPSVVLAIALHAQPAQEPPMDRTETLARELLALLDLSRPELAAVKARADVGDHAGILVAFRDRIIDRSAELDMGKPPGFWLWGHTNPERLLKQGQVGTARYGEFTKYSLYILGKPGEADWLAVPEDGYDVVLRDVATMHWVGRLAEQYGKTRDTDYLRAFVGYWADFSRNWLPTHRQFLAEGGKIQWDKRAHVIASIPWASRSKLYFAWRLDNLFSWLPHAIALDPDKARAAIDPTELADIVLHVARFEIPGAVNGLKGVGTPNQFVHCAVGLLKTSLVLRDLRDGPEWTGIAIDRMQWYLGASGYLPDGSDKEQSFNYNPGLIHSLGQILHLARNNPPFKDGNPPWMARFQQAADWRELFLDCMLMPDGRRPATGCDNTWRHDSARAIAAHAKKALPGKPDLGDRIYENLYGKGRISAPAFTSIYFPHGGWVAQRDGWKPESLFGYMKTSRPGPGHMREGGNGLGIAAYGRYLIVNSGDDSYSDRGVFSRYFHSTASQSSISVDGFSQVLGVPRNKPRYDQPIPGRWHTSATFDLAEGIYESAYGGWNFRTGEQVKVKSAGVRHVRQLLFLRTLGAWIVTDRITADTPREYAQSWCLSPDFRPEDIALSDDGRSLRTQAPEGANLSLRWFTTQPLATSLHCGEKEGEETALGWRAIAWDETARRYTPATDAIAAWRGQGEQIVVTLVLPSPDQRDRIASCEPLAVENGATGFRLRLTDGGEAAYLAGPGGTLALDGTTVEGTALLLVRRDGDTRGLALDAELGGREFVPGEPAKSNPIRVPAGFQWIGNGATLHPRYE
ncbi:MAG: hypothetical protein HN380_08035 [Victivallales bacterium]|jgi:hypothetical protein|nr:hypothetical protein [Victivallales bacterium]